MFYVGKMSLDNFANLSVRMNYITILLFLGKAKVKG